MRLIVDGHLDLAWNALSYGRDITRPLGEVREAEAGLTDHADRGRSTVTLPEMRRGGVFLCIGTLLARSSPIPPDKAPLARTDIDYPTQDIAHAVTRGQLAYYQSLERRGEIRIIRTRGDLDAHVAAWERACGLRLAAWDGEPQATSHKPQAPPPIGVLIGMECADPIVHPDELRSWWDLGLRNIEPSHALASHYAAGNAAVGGLTPAGVDLIEKMAELKMLLDVTHLSDTAMSQALDIYGGPVLASHHNCRSLVDHLRQITDEQVRRIAQAGGVVGVAIYNWMLIPGWETGKTPRTTVTLDRVVHHIDHVCQLTGSSLHSAIGSDLDGGFGSEATPHGIDSISDLPRLLESLDKRGYSTADIDHIAHGNWLRLFRRGLPE